MTLFGKVRLVEGNRYRLVRAIATGGMARVDEGRLVGEGGFERKVALKRVLPEFAHRESMRRMFFDEASIASRLHHGNIVQVLDYGVVDGSEFIAMEFVDGPDANAAFGMGDDRGCPMPLGVALYVVAEMAYAIEYAHGLRMDDDDQTGIVHRDISPHNILFSWDGDVKLSDFGIAFSETKSERTRTGVVKGKWSFMAPEQAAGKRVAGSADIYALGVTLHMLLGRGTEIDRDGNGQALYLEDLSEDPEIPRLLGAMLALDPAERPLAGDVAAAAGRFAARTLNETGRGGLRTWLKEIRRKRPPSALDDLMGLEFVPAGEGRAYTAVRVGAPRADEVSGEEPTEPSGERALSVEVTGRNTGLSRVRREGVTVVLLAAFAAVAVFWVLDEPDGQPTVEGMSIIREPDVEREETLEDPAPSVAESDAVIPVLEESVAPPEETSPAEATPGTLRERPSSRRQARRETVGGRPHEGPERTVQREDETAMRLAREPVNTAETTAQSIYGYIRVPRSAGGARERIRVDGRAVGHTPRVIRVRSGRRLLVIEDADSGAVVLSRRVSVGVEHTRVRPLSLSR